MITIDPQMPNRLATCAYQVMSDDPLTANFILHAEQGNMPVLINKATAVMLITALASFLASDEEDPGMAANDDLPS